MFRWTRGASVGAEEAVFTGRQSAQRNLRVPHGPVPQPALRIHVRTCEPFSFRLISYLWFIHFIHSFIDSIGTMRVCRDPEKNWDRSKVKGLVANLFTVTDVSNATALEVVAGGRLYNIVVDNEVSFT